MMSNSCRRRLSGLSCRVLDWFNGQSDHRLMLDVRVLLIQLSSQALGFLLFEQYCPGSDLSGDGAFPLDRVGFQVTPALS